MTAEEIKVLVAHMAQMPLAQNTSLIEYAMNGTLDEIGVNMKIASAISSDTKTIAAGVNYIIWASKYSQIISVKYCYSDEEIVLEPILPTEYAIENAGLQSEDTDALKHYCPKGDKIYIGPGNAKTGGSIIVEYQRKLVFSDIDKLPDSFMVLWGSMANILPLANPAQGAYRALFADRLVPATVDAGPVKESHGTIKLPDQMIVDEVNRRAL